jgi:uncharacterized iron-regulated protein
MKRMLSLLTLTLTLISPAARADDPALNLPIGDPARRDKQAQVLLDGITDTASGEVITSSELAARLKDARLLFVGESHTSIEFHNAQLAVIKALAKSGRKVMVGLEMYPYTEQPWLDKWSAAELGEDAFLKDSHWYKNWGYHWNYYRDIFLLARDNKIRMFAVNAPRQVVSAVNRKGLAGLTPEERAQIPARIDTANEEHRRLFRAFFGGEDMLHGSGMSAEQWDRMFEAQCTWDAAMGGNAVSALQKFGDKDTIMVVLIGSGHVAYGLGAERQAKLGFDGKTATLIPIPVTDDKGQRPTVRASYANFVWGVANEEHALYPSLGLSTPETKRGEYYPVISVQKGSVAEAAGFKVGDLMVSLDGTPIADKETSNLLMSQKRWGDAAEYVVKRGEETLTLVAKFRRPERAAVPKAPGQ